MGLGEDYLNDEYQHEPLDNSEKVLYTEDQVKKAIQLGFEYAVEYYGIWKNGTQTIGCQETNIKKAKEEFIKDKTSEWLLKNNRNKLV